MWTCKRRRAEHFFMHHLSNKCKVVLVSKYRRFSRLVRVNVYVSSLLLCRHQKHAAATATHVFWLVKNSINTEPWHCEDERCRASLEKVCSMFIKNFYVQLVHVYKFLIYFFPFMVLFRIFLHIQQSDVVHWNKELM